MKYIKKFEDLRLEDIPKVGGKNASLGQMIADLSAEGVEVPTGFASTSQAYWYYLKENKFEDTIKQIMNQLTDTQDLKMLQKVGNDVRTLIKSGTIPSDLAQEITQAYHQLSEHYGQKDCDVAVRSSATAEDLPTASFAGQQETFLNVKGDAQLLEAWKKSVASLFTNRAIVYRVAKGFDHFDVALSVGVQKMIRSDKASSGVAFSLDTESGFKDVVNIDSSYGLGESIVQGLVTPDEFVVFKPTLEKGFAPIIKKRLGQKHVKIVYSDSQTKPVKEVPVPKEEQGKFSLTDDEILEIARAVVAIESHYTKLKNKWSPMDVEWAKDGIDGKIYILQARPETIHGAKEHNSILKTYRLENGDAQDHLDQLLVQGQSIGQQIALGIARVINDVSDIEQVKEGDVIVTQMTDPDWVPAMKRAAGIVTNRGGRTCHAAIVSRELGIPAIVGAMGATDVIKDSQEITIDCSRGNVGYVYQGTIPFKIDEIELKKIPESPTHIMVNIADPGSAFNVSFLPVSGVGLARLEFIITNAIKIHPMALLHPEKVANEQVRQTIADLTSAYASGKDFFVDTLAQGIGMIAAAFYPKPVIVRLSDFKSNEYRNLIGGVFFEPEEENPMLGFRGASRYYHEKYKDAFALECAAFKKVRATMGLTNVKVMVPFVRTINEAEGVISQMQRNGLVRGKDDLEFVMMCEIPSNVILIDQFSKLFDGFSIGSNDLTQLTLGVDRDSELLSETFDERDDAVKKMLEFAIQGAHRNKKFIGICGQAPSDYPDIAHFLIEHKIDSMSLNPDSVLPFLMSLK